MGNYCVLLIIRLYILFPRFLKKIKIIEALVFTANEICRICLFGLNAIATEKRKFKIGTASKTQLPE